MQLPITGLAVLNLIPQREPIVMVSALLHYTDTSVDSQLMVSPENIFVQDGTLQESGLIEHMAQTVAMHTGYSFFIKNQIPPTGYIGSVQKVEIYRLPLLDEIVESTATIIQEFMGVTLVHISSTIDNKLIATAEMKTVIAAT